MSDVEDIQEVSDAELESQMSDTPEFLDDDDDLSSINSEEDQDKIDNDEFNIKTKLDNDSKIESVEKDDEYESDLDDDSDESDEEESVNNTSSLDKSTKVISDKIKKPPIVNEDSSDDEEDEESNDLNKFDNEGINDYLLSYHPECKQHNYDEIYNLSKISRDARGVIVDQFHKTTPILTKYEKTRILGQRAKQIDSGCKPFISTSNKIIDGYLIAEEELKQKKIPFIIRRPIPNGGSEYWKVSDLEVLY